MGYRVIVCADACADPDPEAHAALVDRTRLPTSWLGLWRIANVLPTAEIPLLAADEDRPQGPARASDQ